MNVNARIDLLDSILQPLSRQYEREDTRSIIKFSDWVQKPIMVDGFPFSFDKHEYLKEPYEDNHPFQVDMKSAQMGLTTRAMLRVVYNGRYRGFRGILYLFPSRTDVSDFTKSRIDPLINENPDTIGEWVRDTDATNIKRIWNCFLYLRGMKSRVGLKCHDDKTEVLTEGGWKRFADVTLSDRIATRSPSGIFMWQNPTKIYRYPHHGTMYEFLANGLDFCVTPDHRLLLTSHQNKKREWIETAEQIKGKVNHNLAIVRTCKEWDGVYPPFVKRDRAWCSIFVQGNYKNNRWKHLGRNPDRRVNLRDWVAFLGLYVAEGSCYVGKESTGRVCISQMKTSPHFRKIKSLMTRLPFGFKYHGHNFRVGDFELAKLVIPIGKKYERSLPSWVINLPRRYLEVLWEWALMGDGHVTENGYRIYATTSKRLADQFQEILQKCGRSASILIQTPNLARQLKNGRKIRQTVVCYLVSERKSACSTLPKPNEIQYNGEVFCVTVPNGVIYTRRNGYAIWSGNSVPGDFIVYDELDEAAQTAVDMADERMSHSVYREKMMLSNPTLPDYGIHRHFLLSDQKYWLLKCGCGQWNDLVKDFPKCLVETKNKVIRACRKCGRALNPARGEWVAMKPRVKERSGRQYSQLYSQFVSPAEILHKFRTTNNLKDFYNLKIGVPYIEAENRLSVEEVLALCGDEGMSSGEKVPCFMGVDQGKGLHVVIGKDHPGYSGQLIHMNVYKDWEEIYPLMDNFNVTRAVIDAQPEMRNARKLAEKFKGRVFLNFYSEHQRGSYKWDEEKLVVTCNRTESLDASHQEIKLAQIILPKECDEVRTFANHLHNVGKKLEEEEETGSKRYIYVKLGDDHYRHAYNYECMARQHASGLLYPELL